LKLSVLAALKLINDQDLNPHDLAGIMGQTLSGADLKKANIDLNGAAHTVEWLDGWTNRNLKNS
jgi:predicted glycosyltransferase